MGDFLYGLSLTKNRRGLERGTDWPKRARIRHLEERLPCNGGERIEVDGPKSRATSCVEPISIRRLGPKIPVCLRKLLEKAQPWLGYRTRQHF